MKGDEAWISVRQRLFLRMLAQGYDVRAIARETHFSWTYVYAQLREARAALAVGTDVAAIVEALRWGVIEMPGREEMKASDG